jgi:hypothetical protein
MSRPFTRTQALQNRAFLKALRRTANVRLACRELGLKYGTMQHRRRTHRAFALRWDAEVAAGQARLAGRRGRAHPSPSHSAAPSGSLPLPQGGEGLFRTRGGETVVVRLKSGALQVRRAQPNKLTREAEQAFLAALSVTCNIALSAAAVGAAEAAFHRRKRNDPGFAREMRMAIERGYLEIETALLSSHLAESHEHDDWRGNEPPAVPPMTVNQALQLLYLHQKEARLIAEPDYIRRRPGESREAQSVRLSAMYEERRRREREKFEVAEAERWERGEPAWGPAGEAVRRELGLGDEGPSTAFGGPPPLESEGRIWLPDLAQVTGWSHADPSRAPHHPERALFGGWRMEDMERKKDGSWD